MTCFYIMTNFLTSWRIFDFMTNHLAYLWRDDIFLMSWQTFWSNDEPFVIMTCLDIMTKVLTPGRTVWRHGVFLASWRIFWRNHERFEIMTNFRADKLFDVITYATLLTSWRMFWRHGSFYDMTHFLMPWRTFWQLFNVMVCSLLHDELFVVMTYFWRHDQLFIVLTFFSHHFGNKVLWKRVLDVIDIMINFWCHDKLYKVVTKLLSLCHVFDITTNFFTSWQTFLTYFWRHGKPVDVLACFWCHSVCLTSWLVFDFMTNSLTSCVVITCFFLILW